MTGSMLEDAFAHHVWASLRLIDVSLPLTPQQLGTTVPGTYGSILETQRHLVGADASYLFVTSGGRTPVIDEDQMDLPELRTAMERHAAAWSSVLAEALDPDAVLVRHRDDGSETHAPISIRLAQALHHGTDHRSQICTALTALGMEPPFIDVWDYGEQDGRVIEVPPAS
ncbi:MAG: DinB family protein [Actinomycetota bacterium]